MASAKPPFDPQLQVALSAMPSGDITPDAIPALRDIQNAAATLEITLKDEPFTHVQHTAHGPNGPVTISLFSPTQPSRSKLRPAFYHMHSGGMICGNRFTFFKDPLRWAKAAGAVAITVEYRLAPEHPWPAPMLDCWAGLQYVAEHAAELGIDSARLMVTGQSAGANLATQMAVMARDKGGPKLCGLLLDSGMFDDRHESSAINQYVTEGTWTRGSNVTAWTAYLGDRAGKPSLDPLAAVGRISDLSGLPPAFISVGSAEGFRDENVDLAKKLWAGGVQCELHVWPGGYHCFDSIMPDADVSKASIAARVAWAKRVLAGPAAKL